jgi:hypothetical protein
MRELFLLLVLVLHQVPMMAKTRGDASRSVRFIGTQPQLRAVRAQTGEENGYPEGDIQVTAVLPCLSSVGVDGFATWLARASVRGATGFAYGRELRRVIAGP